jgi:DnaJ-class molecular chaperone
MEVSAMLTDCYFVLGVSPDASLTQIKRAYKRALKKLDAEPEGSDAHNRFMQIKDAYETLSSSSRRMDHNRILIDSRGESDAAERLFDSAFELLSGFERYSPSHEEIRETIEQNFTQHHLPKSMTPRELTVEVMMTPEQAERGGSVPIDFPVADVCHACTGTGMSGLYLCDDCGGQGIDWHSRRIDVLIPAHVNDGTNIPVSLKPFGVNNLFLNVLVRVAQMSEQA